MLKIDATILYTIANILILFLLLRIFLFKPINKIMEERTKAIEGDLAHAEDSKAEAEKLKQEYTEALDEARHEALKIVADAREQAVNARSDILQKAEKEAQETFALNAKAIENERKRSVQAAHSKFADLAIAAASKIIGKSVDDNDNRQLVDDFLQEEGDS